MDTADQWPQDQIATPSDPYGSRAVGEKKVKPQKDQAPLNCPRCHSINTKFCYYNNYSLTQPRYFCKTCRRYWTAGGSLRNVPVGGGSRKNKRSSVSNNLVPKSDQLSQFSFQNPNNYKPHENQDLNLAFPQEYHDGVDVSRFIQVSSKIENKDNNIQLNLNSSYSSSTSTSLSAMELLKINSTGFASRGSNSYNTPASIQNPNMAMYASPGFQFQEFNKPQAGFQGVHGNGNNHENVMNGAADQRLVFPFGALSAKQNPSTNEAEQTKEDGNPTLYWNGMSSGGSW